MLEQLSFCDRINDLCRALQAMRRWGVPCERLEQFAHLHYVPEKDDALDELIESFSSQAMWLDEGTIHPDLTELHGLLCPDWNDNLVRESALFLTGFITHLVLSR
ncbi:hypothetical protein JKP88DRAFT_272942 [Tribonema minus]|uniref:Uncharacterized protein n=1 Tax=Tribonema minus TaxID=303371 RepID=A0A835YWX8_9STRA|nr:hypothetical protein JKP88DRAFT_272942 [Tribonema minus]